MLSKAISSPPGASSDAAIPAEKRCEVNDKARTPFQCAADGRQVVIAVADSVVFQHELARERSIRVERDRRGPEELFVGELADRCGRGLAVRVKQIERHRFRDRGVRSSHGCRP